VTKTDARGAKKDNFIVGYFKETRAEIRKVHWPSAQEARTLTMVVVGVTIAMATLLGLLDFIFDRLTAGIINLNPVAIILTVLIVVLLFGGGMLLIREE
jgi:preprotein translocase SecE subunit